MVVGVPLESSPTEKRVALVPGFVRPLTKAELEVVVQSGAGNTAGFDDASYAEQGARLAGNRPELLSSADLILQVHALAEDHENMQANLDGMRSGQVILGLLDP
ncbi:NAD(P)(+) transhydrogenase (Re/Si-specific) subunit alpha, partial [bacterium]|nr:NAD(P)(+) transhydrogenase (Re/Si-specific) subunit alpha [bacterium]